MPTQTADQLCQQFQITDPVYINIIRWRCRQLQHWQPFCQLAAGSSILEIGTGNYPFSLWLAPYGAEITIVEPDTAAAQNAAKFVAADGLPIRVISMPWTRELPKSNNDLLRTFRAVVAIEVFEHVPAEAQFLETVADVTKPGDWLIVETPNKDMSPLFAKVFGTAPTGGGHDYGDAHVNEVGFHELFRMLHRSGFNPIDFSAYYLPVTLWQDAKLPPAVQGPLFELVHAAAADYPFHAYVQMFLAQRR